MHGPRKRFREMIAAHGGVLVVMNDAAQAGGYTEV
jgi:hypothetical protein